MHFSRNNASEVTCYDIEFITEADCEGNKHSLTIKSIFLAVPSLSGRSM